MNGDAHIAPRGTVYGTLLNFRREYAAWLPQMEQPPYKGAPQAPVLYIKPANTWTPSGASIPVPARVPEVEIGASVAAVMGEAGQVAGFVIVNDLSIPHESYYRPPVKFKALDGFFGHANNLRRVDAAGDPALFALSVKVNGIEVQQLRFDTLVRPLPQLLADVGAFMTLRPGDWLLMGLDVLPTGQRPRARVGDHIEISGPGFATLDNTLVAEAA